MSKNLFENIQIIPYLTDIISLITTNDVVSVIAPTGSGKSLALPATIAQYGSRCFVSVPTRTAALSLTEYQRKLFREISPLEDPDVIVGYAAEGDIKYTDQSRIIYATSGHLRKKLLSYFSKEGNSNLDFCDVLLVDEVHSGSLDNTIILSLWMAASNLIRPRLVIASATPIPLSIQPTPVTYRVDLIRYPITIEYFNKDYEDHPQIYTVTAEKVIQIHKTKSLADGHILVFAPGSSEVEAIISGLRGLQNVIIIPAYGTLKPEAIDLMYQETKRRKIIVATNIAEMSITIENIGFVVDTLLEKRSETSESGGRRLAIHMISKDSATQRAGRTGRTRPGICYRMCTETRYNKLDQHRPPEIDRVPLYETVIELMASGLDPQILLPDLDPERINSAKTLLLSLDMIDDQNNVTPIGYFAPQFPFSIRNAWFLYKWINYAGLRFSPKIIQAGAELYNLNLNHFEIDETSEFSSITPFQMVKVDEIFIQEKLNPTSIIDATANVGGDSMNFMRLFPTAELTSIELDPKIARILRRNMANLPAILNTSFIYKTHTFNTSALEYFNSNYSNHSDLIYFDPPWGGRDYALKDKINLELDNQPLGLFIGDLLIRGLSPLIIVKAPFNVDSERLMTDINSIIQTTISIRDVMNNDKIVYRLFFIRPIESPSIIMNQNKETALIEVELRPPPSYQVFPGLVVTSLIDSYGQSYYWLPRKQPKQRIEEFNIILEQHIQKYYAKYLGYNDLDTCLNMWNDLMDTLQGDLNGDITAWARRNNINQKKISEVLKIIKKTSQTLYHLGYNSEPQPFTTEGVSRASRPLLRSAYFDNILIKGHTPGTYFNPTNKERLTYRISNKSINKLSSNYPSGLIAIWMIEVNPHLKLVSFAVDTEAKVHKSKQPRLIQHSETELGTENRTEQFNPTFKSALDLLTKKPLDENLFEAWILNQDYPYTPFSEYAPLKITDIVQLFKTNKMIFPLLRRIRNLKEIQDQFKNLKVVTNIDTSPFTLEGAPRSTYQAPGTTFETYLRIQDTTLFEIDYFTEVVRIHDKSIFTSWYQYDIYLEQALNQLKQNRENLTIQHLREALDLKSHDNWTSVIITILRVLNVERPCILDTDIGYGERLVASIAIEAGFYSGLNPENYSLAGYYEIINKLADGAHDIYRIGNVTVVPGAYDIAWVSDPENEDRNIYLNRIFPNILKAWEALKIGGYLIVQNVGSIAFLASFPEAWYCGPIVYGESEVVWIWCKFPHQNLTEEQQITYETLQINARAILKELYPEIGIVEDE